MNIPRSVKYVSLIVLAFAVSFHIQAQNIKSGRTTPTEEPTKYPGGMDAFNEFVVRHMKYPRDARKEGVEGKVLVEFDVDTDGELIPGSAKVLRSLMPSCDDEAIRLLRQSFPWIPGSYNGRPKAQKMVIVIPFTMEKNRNKAP